MEHTAILHFFRFGALYRHYMQIARREWDARI